MKTVLYFFLPACLVLAHSAFSQCPADSVIMYRLVGGNSEIASVEYFEYDEKDSLVASQLNEMRDGKLVPVSATWHTGAKVKGKWVSDTYRASWDPAAGNYGPRSLEQVTYDKKGNLVSRTYSDEKTIRNGGEAAINFVGNVEVLYTHDKEGHLLEQLYLRYDANSKNWNNEAKMTYTYNEQGLNSEIITSSWDTTEAKWKSAWKNEFVYDEDSTRTQSTTYEYVNGTWLPKSRTESAMDADGPVRYDVVMKWSSAKEDWTNEFCYVMKLNDAGQTKTEVHLIWVNKEWQITQTVSYEYNAAGYISQILNDQMLVIMDRFCR